MATASTLQRATALKAMAAAPTRSQCSPPSSPRWVPSLPEQEKAKYQAKIDRYETEKNEIKKAAEGLEAEARAFDEKSEAQMHQHHRWAQATTALQVAIALAAIALLTRKKWLEWGMYGVAAIGLGVGTLALLHI